MLFQTSNFLLSFLGLLITLMVIRKPRIQTIVLLLFSYGFYCMFNFQFIWCLLASTLVDYFVGLRLARTASQRNKKVLLGLSLATNIGLLLFFKFYFVLSNELGLHSLSDISSRIIFPIGISFYTFQTLSYTFDIYYGRIKPEKDLSLFALYVSFFPQILAGPIERAKHLIPQLRNGVKIESSNIIGGARLFLWGFFKKVLVADKLDLIADSIFNNPNDYYGFVIIVGILGYGIQIYCDFSGYCDMAIGIARVLGINLSTNFNFPYLSSSFQTFWKRWHISLSNWFRTYLYIPLGGNKKTLSQWLIIVFIVFIVSGVWHGSRINFLIWGFLHYLFYISERLLVNRFMWIKKIPRTLSIITVFICVNFAWLFFRSNSMPDSIQMLTNLVEIGKSNSNFQYINNILILGADVRLNTVQLLSILVPLIIFLVFEFSGIIRGFIERSQNNEFHPVDLVVIDIILVCSILLVGDMSYEFIYFQF